MKAGLNLSFVDKEPNPKAGLNLCFVDKQPDRAHRIYENTLPQYQHVNSLGLANIIQEYFIFKF